MRSQPHKHYGLNRKRRRDTDGDQLALTRVLDYVSKVLGVALPDMYLQPDEPGELLLANTSDRRCLAPALVARGDALRGRSGRELAHLAGRSLSLLRTEHLVKLAFSDTAELQATLDAAVALARSSVPMVRGLTLPAEQMLSSLQVALTPGARERLTEVVARCTHGDDELDVTAWTGAADLTAQRVAFILCGDLRVAARAIAREAVPAGGMAPSAKLDELLLYSVSEDYFAVRKYLGATIDQIARATQRLKSAA
jgi:hypothetical protein